MVNKVTRKISTSGKYSKVINLPREFLRKLGWREDQNLSIELDEKAKRIIIKDAKQ
jgi:bifunctional DNA-binding transcriptional regulator/antitoxin component of YhaV-PrlF toxin-antitoxin module